MLIICPALNKVFDFKMPGVFELPLLSPYLQACTLTDLTEQVHGSFHTKSPQKNRRLLQISTKLGLQAGPHDLLTFGPKSCVASTLQKLDFSYIFQAVSVLTKQTVTSFLLN